MTEIEGLRVAGEVRLIPFAEYPGHRRNTCIFSLLNEEWQA